MNAHKSYAAPKRTYQMKISSLPLLLLFCTQLMLSCSEEKKPTQKSYSSANEAYLQKIDSLLPSYINPNDYVIIYRFGSAEWTPWSSVCCIPKKELNKELLPVDYFKCEIDFDGVPRPNKPAISMYHLKIKNPDVKSKLSDFDELPKIKFASLDKFVSDFYKKLNYNEGYCANIYLIRCKQSNSIAILDKQTTAKIVNYLKTTIRKISALEYYQSLSLEKDCGTSTGLSSKLRLGKELDTFDFAFQEKYGD
ncbi:MAG: hypothetical protein RLZZ301_731 [Bacteroidota bacterium]|jgi:hypothetical protein